MEPVTSLLDALIKLADRLTNLEKARRQDKQSLFNEFVHPLFTELEPVAADYMNFFRKARRTIKRNTKKDLRSVIEKIQKERERMSMTRIKMREMAGEIEENFNDPEIVEFAKTIRRFFYSAQTPPRDMLPSNTKTGRTSEGTQASSLIRKLEHTVIKKTHKNTLIAYIDQTLKRMENSWAAVVQSYERLKIQAIAPKKYVKKRKTKKTGSH